MARLQQGDLTGAMTETQEAVETGSALHGNGVGNLDETVNNALDYYQLGEILRARKQWQPALRAFQQSQALSSRLPASAIEDASDREKLANLPARIDECIRRPGKKQGKRL